MAAATTARMYGLWVAFVVADGVVAVTLSPTNTAGYLSVAGCVVVLALAWRRQRRRRRSA